jgi:hypothetical protein
VLESSRAKEQAVQQETAEQLESFRKHRAAAEQALLDDTGTEAAAATNSDAGSWAAKKRKRRQEKQADAAGNGKLRKLSATEGDASPGKDSKSSPLATSKSTQQEKDRNGIATAGQKSSKLGLAAYSSDESD